MTVYGTIMVTQRNFLTLEHVNMISFIHVYSIMAIKALLSNFYQSTTS